MNYQASIPQLERDNATLSQAAEEAATLAEALASQNAQLQAQLTDLRSTISERDQRIARLTAAAEKHAAEGQRLHNRVVALTRELDEQFALAKVADEMETTLRHTINALQQRLGLKLGSQTTSQTEALRGTPVPLLRLAALQEDIISMVPEFFASDNNVRQEFSALRLLLMTASVDAVATYAVANFPTGATVAAPLRKSLADAAGAARRAAAWVFTDTEDVVNRTSQIDSALATLRERVISSTTEVSRPAFPSTDAAPVDVQAGLINLSIEAVDGFVRNSLTLSPFQDKELSPSVRNSLRHRAERFRNTPRLDASVDVAHRLEETIAARERELEDATVRCAAFENAVTKARNDITSLRDALAGAEAEIERLRTKEDSVVDNANDGEDNIQAFVDNENHNIVEVAPEHERTPLEKREVQRNLRRLRNCYLRGAISDLKPLSSDFATLARDHDVDTYNAMSAALQRARVAAANAHVVRLDPQTLIPTTCGATMSRRGLLEAIAAARTTRARYARSSRQITEPCATEARGLRVIVDNDDGNQIVKTFRELVT